MEYELAAANLTARETGTLKRRGNIRGIADLAPALGSGDLEVVVSLLGIAMERKGHKPEWEKLMELTVADIGIDIGNPTPPTAGKKK
jgi:hypothetical protein